MKFRIGSKFTNTLPAPDLTDEQFIVVAKETCAKLEWDIRLISPHGIISYSGFSMSSYNEEITIRREDNTIIIKSECLGNQLHDWGKNEKNTALFSETFDAIRSELTNEDITTRYEELKNSFVAEEEDILKPEVYSEINKKSGFLYLFVPRDGYFVTPIIINLNILVFIAMCISGVNFFLPDTEAIYKWGGNYGSGTLNGQWWRLLTCAFVHIGIFHLLMNMYALMYIGLFLEPILGKTRMTAAYLLTGICSGILSLYVHPDIVSAGASGAIFGMYGVFLALMTTNIVDKTFRKAVLPSILIFVLYNLANGMKAGIDNAGHIGGLIGGLIIGLAMYPSLKSPDNKKLTTITLSGISILVLAATLFSFSKTKNSDKEYESAAERYQKNMRQFVIFEETALRVYSLTDSVSNERLLYSLREQGIKNWDSCAALLLQNDSLDIPAAAININDKLKQYVTLRKEAYGLAVNNILQGTDMYTPKINSINKEINDLIAELEQSNKEK